MKEYNNSDIEALNEAIEMSRSSVLAHNSDPCGGPFGAVIYKNGVKIAEGFNHVLANNDPSAHAEVYTIRKACERIGSWDLSDCVLYTSCEPCPMCLMTAKWANIKKIYFAATRKDAANIGFRDDDLYNLLKDGVYGIHIPECQENAVQAMTEWYHKFSQNGKY